MAPADGPTGFHRAGCLCPGHELRITQRCLVDDLGMPRDTSFERAVRHPLVESFQSKRQDLATGGKTVGPDAAEDTLYHLGSGNDHRGATWFEPEHHVVWLCAYGRHRSGEVDDAFQLFAELLKSGEIYPDERDYRSLRADREIRFTDLAPTQAALARADAICTPSTIIQCTLVHTLARILDVRVIAEVAGDLAEISVAFTAYGMTQSQILFLIACFAPEDVGMPEWVDDLVGRSLLPGEIAFRFMTPVE